MQGRVTIDFETRSYADLGITGEWVYSQHPSTEIICLSYKVVHADGTKGAVTSWVSGQPAPQSLFNFIAEGYLIEAHKYSFELSIWENICVPRLGWPAIPRRQWRDTMAVACYMAMPAALDALCRAIGIPGKAPEGARLISKYSKLYLKTAKTVIPSDDLAKFVAYCEQDVECEDQVSDYLGDLPERELENFFLDQTINMRGLLLDQEGIAAATEVVEQRAAELTEEFVRLTGFRPTQLQKLKDWFILNGVPLESMQASYLEEVLESGYVPPGIGRTALMLRLKLNKASTSKLTKMAAQVDNEGLARWQVRYHGAQTGRQTGSGFQPLNLVRSWEEVDPEQLVRDIKLRDPAWLDTLYGDATEAVSRASRHWIIAGEDHDIYAGDFNSIEAVVLSELAGEEWKIEAFRNKVKIYEMMADKIYGLPPGTVTKKTHPAERQDGKTGELAFGYQGALNAWLKFDSSGRHTDERIIEICKAWRKEHPAIVAMWRGLEDASILAVQQPGLVTSYRSVSFEVVEDWLSMILPNGKRIWYYQPELRAGMPQWHKPQENADCAEGTCRCKPVAKLTYMAQKTGKWVRTATYGGKLTENATQGTAREYLNPAILALEKAGYPMVLSVYDEAVARVPKGFGSKEEFEHILLTKAGGEWSKGWPIGIDAWVGKVYKK